MTSDTRKGRPEEHRKLERLEFIELALTVAGRALGLVIALVFAIVAIQHANAAEWHVAAFAAAGSCGALAAVTNGGKGS
jgi:hypothetical protein